MKNAIEKADRLSSLDSKVWVDKYGNEIPVNTMKTSYIKNCIRAFESGIIRKTYYGGKDKWMKIFNEELADRIDKKIKNILE